MTFKEYIKSIKIDKDEISMCRELDICNRRLTDINGIEKFTKLEVLSLDGNMLTDIKPLSNLKNLYELSIVSNNIKNIKPLNKLINIQFLYLDKNPISDITPLRGLINIEILGLEYLSEIKDSSPLKELKNINTLFLKETLFNDLFFFINMDKLNKIHIDVDNFKVLSDEMLEVFFNSYKKFREDIHLITAIKKVLIKERRVKIISELLND